MGLVYAQPDFTESNQFIWKQKNFHKLYNGYQKHAKHTLSHVL